jgi:hypothetical protein
MPQDSGIAAIFEHKVMHQSTEDFVYGGRFAP